MPQHLIDEIVRQIGNIEDHLQEQMDPEVQQEFLTNHAPDIKYLLRRILMEHERKQAA